MSHFSADIAGMLELFSIAAGLMVLHRASKEAPANLLKAAGWVLLVGGILGMLSTSYYYYKYQSQGEFDRAHMDCPAMMECPQKAMKMGMDVGMGR